MRWLFLAAAGSLVCTLCDHLHVAYGVLYYPHPSAWGQAWWVPLLFAGATIAGVVGAMPQRRLLGSAQDPAPTKAQLAADVLAFVAAYAYTAFAPAGSANLTLVVLVVAWALRARRKPLWMIAFSLTTALSGTLFEAGWSALGFFHYYHPDFLGVPRWLPGIYLHAALAAGAIETVMNKQYPSPCPLPSGEGTTTATTA